MFIAGRHGLSLAPALSRVFFLRGPAAVKPKSLGKETE